MRVIAHRGHWAAGYPENTLAAVHAALDVGVDAVEVDVRVSADGVPVCVHDADLGRVAGIPVAVADTTYDDLRRVPLAGGAVLPTLAAVLDVAVGRAPVVLDVKCGASAVSDLLDDRRLQDDVVLSSFDLDQLGVFADRLPGIRRALLTGSDVDASTALRRTLDDGHHDMHPHMGAVFADPATVERAANTGTRVRAWTVNRPVDARLLAVAGVDAVITDAPDRIRRQPPSDATRRHTAVTWRT